MVMKVFNKGQIVIPALIRKELGVSIGDLLEVDFDRQERCIRLKPRKTSLTRELAGSLSDLSGGRKRPSKGDALAALRKGVIHGR